MAHPRDSRISFQPQFGRSHDPNPQEAVNINQNLSEEQKDDISQAFTLFDQDHDGYLDCNELKLSLKALGFELPKLNVYDLFTKNGIVPSWHPPNKPCPVLDHRITTQVFEAIATRLIASRDPQEELSRVFLMFDQDGNGIVTLEDLRATNSTIKQGTAASDEDLKNMIEQADLTGKGGVDREEFIHVIMKCRRGH